MSKPLQHGKIGTYTNRRCRCDKCRAAWTAYCMDLRRRRREKAESGLISVPHGTDGGYGNYHCRCFRCRLAHSRTKAAYKVRLKG
jgi:hypothetical protein